MVETKRSERLTGKLLGVLALVCGLAGCSNIAPEIDDVLEKKLMYKEMNFTEGKLAERMKEIDSSYAEPRTPTKVQLSYETSLDSISKVNGYEALWRGTRACAWLGLYHPERAQREQFAEKGIRMGYEAVKKTSTKVESHYYLALCIGGLADVRGTASPDLVKSMKERMLIANAINPGFDHCGPDRFLGELTVKTADYPLWGIGTVAGGLEMLRRACANCPDFGENHLIYARSLMDDGQTEKAREELDKVLKCPKPQDYTAEHEKWLQEATTLLTELQPET